MQKFALLSCLILLVSGCGKGSAPPEPVFPVSGVITFKGQPVVGADITFMNVEKKRSAFGRTNAEGAYKLTTFAQNDGAVEGKSIVTVAKFKPPAPDVVEPGIESEAYEPPVEGVDEVDEDAKSDIPAMYADQATSGLFAAVSPTGENTFNFELE